MRKLIVVLPLLLAACNSVPGQGLSNVVSIGMQTSDAVCSEAAAIRAAATTPEGLALAAQAGVAAGKVVTKASKLYGYIQAYCGFGAPLAAGVINTIQTASAQVLATHAAPPALVAAAKGQ